MIDWLYDELDQTNSTEFQDHLSSCSSCEEELRSLEATREAFSGLPEEEPPAAVSAILLHEAAKVAPAKAAVAHPIEDRSGGFWAWLTALFQPLAAHPAAAAVASLVLVAGVAGALYVTRGDQHIARPEAVSSARPDNAAPSELPPSSPTALEGAAGDSDDDAIDEPAAEFAAEPSPSPATASPKTESKRGFAAGLLPADEEEQLKAEVAKQSRRQQERDVAKDRRSLSRADRAAKLGGKKRAKISAPPTANAISGTDPLISLDEGGESLDDDKNAIDSSGSGLGLAAEKTPAKTSSTYRVYKERELRWARTQRKALTQAVKKDDCRRAARIANDILDRNRDYYTKAVKGSKDVKRCKWYVSDERKRRVKTRAAKRGAKRRKNAAGVPSKAKAAPQRDEMVETAE